jgi:hypothetical protein
LAVPEKKTPVATMAGGLAVRSAATAVAPARATGGPGATIGSMG